MKEVYLTRYDNDAPPTFYAVPITSEDIKGKYYRKDQKVEEILENMPDYWLPYSDPEELLQVFTIRDNKPDKRIEVGDDLYVLGFYHGPQSGGRCLGVVERIIEAP